MSFRLEEKIPMTKLEGIQFLNSLSKEKNFKHLYPQRIVHSLYFDTLKKDSFNDSEEGIIPRKKIRIRKYINSKEKNFFKEIKINFIKGRYKISKKIENSEKENLLINGYLDDFYGLVFPILSTEYTRQYFFKSGIRITYDSNIKYISYKFKSIFKIEPMDVAELKIPFEKKIDISEKIFNLKTKRFSKYSNAVKLLNNFI